MRRAHDINEQRRVRFGMAVLLGCTFERYPDRSDPWQVTLPDGWGFCHVELHTAVNYALMELGVVE